MYDLHLGGGGGKADLWTHWLKQNTRVCADVDIWWLFGCEYGYGFWTIRN